MKGVFEIQKTQHTQKFRISDNPTIRKPDTLSFPSLPKTALLVDDVLTAGSTLKEAAKVLKKNGFEKVWGVVLAQD